ncbi:hypothetical protein ACH5RR_038539 [Cinchona calisaya]|uniref:Uncharacterized protein n=1 Tax=Cinchona calisaya TaxID=153742 RepID=A0ABD2XVJ9_9GENT
MFWMVFLPLICKLSFLQIIASRDANFLNLENSVTDKIEKSFDTYIVHLSSSGGGFDNSAQSESLESRYAPFLPKNASGLNDASRIVHLYRNVFNGFAARLTAEEAKEMQQKNGLLFARPPKMEGHNNIVLDGGIFPNHPSFSDQGVPPPPAKWKGKCELNGSGCNNKLIGASNFVGGKPGPPIDEEGHGTHIASIAAGNFVENANVFGNANGTAVGMAPLAHLASYKVCASDGCAESDILAGMDAAVQDGVDVISLSIGGAFSRTFFHDVIAIGSFHAIQKGIFVSCSAGNSGPSTASVVNDAPWILTVGASSINRNIWAIAQLENGVGYFGQSAFQPKDFPTTFLPSVYPGAKGGQNAAFCASGSLNNTDVRGKIVVCDRGGEIASTEKGQTVKDAGGAGMILANLEIDGESTIAEINVVPAIHVIFSSGESIKAYINSTLTPRVSFVFEGTMIGIENSPLVASFSSRGPSLSSPGILKPDITGPGVSILAACPLSVENNTNTKSTFNILSGTSMSSPHLSGIAALIKSAHPDWSPAAIKSALMTTSDISNHYNTQPIFDERFQPADVFAIGAGHVNPTKALNPGLVYDIQPDDYIPYFCGLGYKDREIELIIQRSVKCSKINSIT